LFSSKTILPLGRSGSAPPSSPSDRAC
jgi:hypothetical protein